MDYYCQVKVTLTDHRFCEMNTLTSDMLELIQNNEIYIRGVPPSTDCINICGHFSEDIGPGLCLIKFGNHDWETWGIGAHTYKKLHICYWREKFAFENINIKIKVWFPKVCQYDYEGGDSHTIIFDKMHGASE